MGYDVCGDSAMATIKPGSLKASLEKINIAIDSLSYIQHEHSLWGVLRAFTINNLTAVLVYPREEL